MRQSSLQFLTFAKPLSEIESPCLIHFKLPNCNYTPMPNYFKVEFYAFYLEKLFVDRLSRPLEMLFKGEVLYTVTGRALRRDFTLELSSSDIIGKAGIGGKLFRLLKEERKKGKPNCTTEKSINRLTRLTD